MTEPNDYWRPVTRPVPLRETVRATLEDMIVHGALEVGEHLREEPLAERLGVSRQPVREALLHLTRDGFVDLHQGRGCYVHVPTGPEIDDVLQVRRVLEAETARLAARRITEETLRELGEICARAGDAVPVGDKRVLVDLNHSFHALVAHSAGNKVLAELLAGLQKRIDWYFAVVAVERAPSSWEQHAEILAALAGRDETRAAELMSSHVRHTHREFDELYGASG